MATAKNKTSKSGTAQKTTRATAKKSTRGTAQKSSTRGTAQKRTRSASVSQATTDHEEIRRWAEARQGQPACVRGTGNRGDIGVLRIDFPGGEEAKLQGISWDDWFDKFDERGLAFLHQDKTAAGKISRFNKLVSRETAESKPSSGRSRKSSGAKTHTATS